MKLEPAAHAVIVQAEIDRQFEQLWCDCLGNVRVATTLAKESSDLLSADAATLDVIFRLAKLGHAVVCVSKMQAVSGEDSP